MIFEQAIFSIVPGSEADFEAVMAGAEDLIRESEGPRSFKLHRGIENASTFMLLSEWDSLDHHHRFRQTDGFKSWRESVGQYFAESPQIQHFQAPTVVV